MSPELVRITPPPLTPIKFPGDFWDRHYYLKEIRKCFPTIPNPTVPYWLKIGYLPIVRGDRGRFCFTGPEVIHLGFIAQLALCAAININTTVYLSEANDAKQVCLGDVEKILTFCRAANYELIAGVTSQYAYKNTTGSRNKAATIETAIDISSAEHSLDSFYTWEADSWVNLQSYSYTTISLYRIAAHVATTV